MDTVTRLITEIMMSKEGHNNSTGFKGFALYTADPNQIPSTQMPCAPSGVTPEHRVMNKPGALPGVTQE